MTVEHIHSPPRLREGERVQVPGHEGIFIVTQVSSCRALLEGDKRTAARGVKLGVSPYSEVPRVD